MVRGMVTQGNIRDGFQLIKPRSRMEEVETELGFLPDCYDERKD